jgi:predicted CXXCH cytochrome family protein
MKNYRGNILLTTAVINLLILVLLTFSSTADAVVEAPRNPDSAKECAICHYRWIDTFFVDNRGSELVEYQIEKVVAKPEICFSCHDGSVVDSRARVYNDHRHRIDKPPPDHMEIPKIFPLDNNGNMQCATCHTAHGVPSEMGIEKTIFIRSSNRNSSMCKMCHTDKNGGLQAGNHPIGTQEQAIPRKLISHGASVGDGKNEIICETCHVVHGSPNESFLIESARKSHLCLECHSDKNIFTPDGKRNHNHVINATSEQVEIPQELIKRGAKLGYDDMIICQTCHKVHNNKIEKNLLLIKKDNKSTLCLTCHSDKKYIADTKHNLTHTAPEEKNLEGKTVAEAGVCSSCHLPHKEARKTEDRGDYITQMCLSCHNKGHIAEKAIPPDYRHPLDINPFQKEQEDDTLLSFIGITKEDLRLPLFNEHGVQDINGTITCTTCHDPHRWRHDSTAGEIREDVKGDSRTSFLRKPSHELCQSCHSNKSYIANSKHDISKVAPEEKNTLGQLPAESGLCATCHLVHGGQKGYLWARKIISKSGSIVQDLCVSCHADNGMANKKIIKEHSHPVNVSPQEKGLSTTLPLYDKDGKVSKQGLMTCQTCHDPHRWDPLNVVTEEHYKTEGNGMNSFLRIENSPSPKLCENCHPGKSLLEKTDHDLLVSAPSAKNIIDQTPEESGTCGVCHIIHNGKNEFKLWAQGFATGSSLMDTMCNSCHSPGGSAEKKIPLIDSHPEGQLITNVGRDDRNKPNYFPLYEKWTGEYSSVGPPVSGQGKRCKYRGNGNKQFSQDADLQPFMHRLPRT